MKVTRLPKDAWRFAFLLCAAGTLLGSSCGLNELNAVSAGLDAAASSLDRHYNATNTSFGDWLVDELRNL